MSKLLDKLDKAAQPAPRRMGFVAADTSAPVPPLVLIVRIDSSTTLSVPDAAEHAVASYPHYVGGLSPYALLAESAERLGRRDSAVEALTTYWQAGGRLTGPLTRLAEWREEAGVVDEALEVRQALALVAPLKGEHRVALGDRLLAAGAAADARREYVAYQALGPHDRADAHYRLARALFALDDLEAARREVLLALEIAPTYSDALRLLTDVTRRSRPGSSDR